jgi:hypothetical protein
VLVSDDPKEILKQRLERAIDERDTEGLHFFCQIGGRYLDEGMTTLQVSGTGWTLLGWRNDEDRRLVSVDLSWSDQERLYEILLQYPFWETSPARRDRRDNEKNIHLRFSDRDAATYSGVHFWNTEMDEFPELHGLMIWMSEFIQNLSDGDIPKILTDSLEKSESSRAFSRV